VCEEVSESGTRERLSRSVDGDWESEWKRMRGAKGEGRVGSSEIGERREDQER